MPIVSIFFGIIVRVFHDDHNPPHFHVEHAEYKAVIEIKTGRVMKGNMTKKMAFLVTEWRKVHVRELLYAWYQAQAGKQPRKIQPLR